jgi:hypothetical protein
LTKQRGVGPLLWTTLNLPLLVGPLALGLAFACSPAGSSPSPGASGSAANGNAGASTGGSATGGSSAGGANGSSAGTSGSASGASSAAGSASAGSGNVAGSAGSTAGGSAGSGGAGSTDYCSARAGLSLCETFETQPAGAAQAKAPWTPAINGDGQVTIDDQVAHGGKQSLKIHGSGFTTFLVLNGAPFPPTSGPLHVRMYVRLAEPMTGGHNTFLVADTQAAPGAGNAFRLGEMNAMLMYTVMGDTHGALANENYYNDHLPGAALTALSWSCLEVALDHQKPEVQVSLDGKAIADLHHTDWALDAYDTLRFGFEKYAGPVSDVWYDDIAVGTAPLGCN